MGKLAEWVERVAFGLGAPGLFIAAFLDSSFLSLPEINDLLVVWMVTRDPERYPLFAGSATAGSVAGCLVLYYVGRRGGETMLRKRFRGDRIDRALSTFQRYGVLAVLIPSLLPPPAPFKIFVLLAGVAGISRAKFTVAIAIGRGIRYFGEGLLAVWYGETAIDFLRAQGATISLVLVALLVIGLATYVFFRRRRRQTA